LGFALFLTGKAIGLCLFGDALAGVMGFLEIEMPGSII
jgi:hypothetical protein